MFSKRKHWPIVAGHLISILFLGLVLRKVERQIAFNNLSDVDLPLLLLAVPVIYSEFLGQTQRWRTLMREKLSYFTVLRSVMAGHFFNTILPARIGELIRPFYLSRQSGKPFVYLLGTCVVERLFDGLILALPVLLAMFLISEQDDQLRHAAFIGTISYSVIVLIVVIILRSKLPEAMVDRFPWESARKFAAIKLLELRRGLGSLQGFSHALLVLIWSLVPLSLNILSNYIIINAIGLPEQLTGLGTAALIAAATTLAYTIPSAPSSIGVINFAIIIVLEYAAKLYDIEVGQVLTNKFVLASFAVYFASILPDIFSGAYLLLLDRKGMSKLFSLDLSIAGLSASKNE